MPRSRGGADDARHDSRAYQRGERRVRRGLPDGTRVRGRRGRAAQRRRVSAGDELDALPPADGDGGLPGAVALRRGTAARGVSPRGSTATG